MIRHCNSDDVRATVFELPTCGATYDDLDHSTVCPHDPLPPKLDYAAMERALAEAATPEFLASIDEKIAEVQAQFLEHGYARLDLGDGHIVEIRP